jgi:hypothetical protein
MLLAPVPSQPVPAPRRRPLHERIALLGRLRGYFRSAFFGLLRRVAQTDDAKRIQVDRIEDLLPRRPRLRNQDFPEVGGQPYPDLGQAQPTSAALSRDDVVIITARFRSGSTLLWNLFRATGTCTAYYEPFNERRWFDPNVRGARTDPTHRGVADYWREYEGLEELGRYYREEWISRHLFMDEDCWDPGMKRYVELLIERAPHRPVLQFNRIDFRLPWFRHTFPRATIVHLYRHPRDQWISTLVDPAEFTREGTMAAFHDHDHYYLGTWAEDLQYHFPFLNRDRLGHPYQMFYFIWKLSYLFGRRYAHLSLAYEDILQAPAAQFTQLFRTLRLDGVDPGALAKLVEQPRSGRWRQYASDEWFRDQESHCESVLAEFLVQ